CDTSDLLLGGFRVNRREHSNWKESLRRGLAELRRPSVEGLTAGIPQFGFAHLHGENWRKHERRLDSIAIHISEAFVRRGRPAGFADSASVQSQWGFAWAWKTTARHDNHPRFRHRIPRIHPFHPCLRRVAHDAAKTWASLRSTSPWADTPSKCDRRLKSLSMSRSSPFDIAQFRVQWDGYDS